MRLFYTQQVNMKAIKQELENLRMSLRNRERIWREEKQRIKERMKKLKCQLISR
jgi:hypothetical protein